MSKKTTSEASSTKGSVSSEEGVARKTSVLSSEDMRKLEDRLEVIDRRQAEVEEGQNKVSLWPQQHIWSISVCVQALVSYRLVHNP